MIAYILMADIVDSRDRDSSLLMKEFKAIISKVKGKHKNSFLSPITITLGDEFQSVVKTLEDALNVLVDIEEEMIQQSFGFKLRYVLYQGEIDTKINSKIAYEMLGEGLTNARGLLNSMKSISEKRVSIHLLNNFLSELLNEQFFLFTSLIDRWSVKNFGLIKNFLDSGDYQKVANKMGKDRSLIWRREKTLQMRQYFAIKKSIHIIVTNLE